MIKDDQIDYTVNDTQENELLKYKKEKAWLNPLCTRSVYEV